MIITMLPEDDEQGLEPLFVFCVNRSTGEFTMKWTSDVTKEQAQLVEQHAVSMLRKSVEKIPHLQ